MQRLPPLSVLEHTQRIILNQDAMVIVPINNDNEYTFAEIILL
jgi:hypothetical protein